MSTSTHRTAAVAAVFVIGATSCAASQSSSEPIVQSVAVELAAMNEFPSFSPSTLVPGYTDGHAHFVVTTTDELTVDSFEERPAIDADALLGLASVAELHTADGLIDIDIPDGSLRIVEPDNVVEYAALEAFADSVVAFIVDDVDGVVDGTLSRYVYTESGLHTIASDLAAGDLVSPGSAVVPSETDVAVAQRIADLDGTVEVTIVSPGILAVVTDSDGSDLADVSGVADVHDDVTFGFTTDPYQPLQWPLDNTGEAAQSNGRAGTPGADIDAPQAWEASTGSGIVVAVIDSGVKLDHPDLAGRISTNPDEICGNGVDDDANGFVDDCNGWDFGSNDANPSPDRGGDYGHGTHVAGIIAAGDNGIGVVGVAPDATIMPLKVSNSSGQLSTAALMSAIRYAADNGADVINLSLGTNPGLPRGVVSGIEDAVAHADSAGVVVLAAAGNNGVDITSRSVWPASLSEFYPRVLAVGATNNSDARAWFSNFGSPLSIWAPGESLLSTSADGGHEWRSGTSMATPVAAGAVAVVLASGAAVADDVRSHLQSTSTQTAAGARIDLASAVGNSTATSVSVSVRGADTLTPDAPASLDFDLTALNATDATQVRLSVATLDSGDVAAVSTLGAQITGPNGIPSGSVTNDSGAFPPVAVAGDLSAGVTIGADLALPAGQYAFVTELLTASGALVGDAQVAYLAVSDQPEALVNPAQPGEPSATNPPATNPPANATPATPTTAPPSNGGSGGNNAGPTVTTTPAQPAAPGTALPTAPTTTPPNGGSGVTGPTTPTTVPALIGTPTPPTTVPSTPTNTVPSTPTNTVPSTPTDTTPANTAPANTAPPAPGNGTSTPPTTTPTPTPDAQGQYRLTSMTPRIGSTSGGDVVILTGQFPTNVPVFVWWGDQGIVQAHRNTGDQLTVRTPSVSSAMVTDVIVKFTTARSHELTLTNAFTFVEPVAAPTPTPGNGNGTTPPPAATPNTPSNGNGNSGSNSGGGNVAPTTPGNTPNPTTPAQPGTPATTTPPSNPTQPPTTNPAQLAPPNTAPTDWTRQRGALTLRPPAAGTAIAQLSASSWQPGCSASTCSTSHL